MSPHLDCATGAARRLAKRLSLLAQRPIVDDEETERRVRLIRELLLRAHQMAGLLEHEPGPTLDAAPEDDR